MPAPRGFRSAGKLDFPSSKCARGSFRYTRERKRTRVLVCCPRGKYSRRTGRCRAHTRGVEAFERKKKRRR